MEDIELLDVADDLLVVNKATIERLFQEVNTDVLVLYIFYYKTAKWQKHNPIKANDEYCRKCLHWGLDKLKAIKKRLKDMELIEVEKRFNEKHQLSGWYVRVNYYINKADVSSGVISTSRLFPLVDKQETNTINNNINTNNNKNNNDDDNIIDFLQKNGFVLNDILYDVVKEWEDTELTRYAIKKAVLNNKYNINYIQKILYSYEKNNIKSIQEAIEQDEEFNIKKDLYYKNKYKTKETRYEREQRIMEEWAKDEQD